MRLRSLPLVFLLVSRLAHAHPHGPSVDRTIDLVYAGDGVFRAAYTLDFSGAPAMAELDALDAHGDGAVTEEEQRAYLARRVPPLIARWEVDVDGASARATLVASHLDVIARDAGFPTLHIDCEVRIEGKAPAAGEPVTLRVRDDSFAGMPGAREIRMEGDATRVSPASGRAIEATFLIKPPVQSFLPLRLWMGVALGALGALASVVLLRRERRK